MVGKTTIDISTILRYLGYEELYDAIHQCHIDQEGHFGIIKTEGQDKKHYMKISRMQKKSLPHDLAKWTEKKSRKK